MSFLKKKGRQVWVPEVKGEKYVPGYWYTYDEYVLKYVPGSSGPTAPVVKDNGTIFVPGGGIGGSGPPLIVDY